MALYEMSATELAEGIRNRQFTSVKVLESIMERIEQVNKITNAIVVPLYEEARKKAICLDEMAKRGKFLGPLHGVPVTIKESIDVKGTASTWGINGRETLLAEVSRLREAGAIVIGKTNAMQLLMGCETVNPVYGRTNNPWNPSRTPDGSSGGEGAAVASLCSPLGIGTDIGGSIRTPAHFCGIHGLKPTPGLIPQNQPSGISRVRIACLPLLPSPL